MGYYDDWDEGREQVFDEPTPDQINDCNIHNDHQDNNEDNELFRECDTCGELYIPNWGQDDCDACMTTYWRNNPHPLDVAQQEFEQDQYSDLIERSYGE